MSGRHYTSLGYCDEVDIENYLLLDIDNTFSGQVEDWIRAAEEYVNRYTGYTTASGLLAETITGERTRGTVDTECGLIVFPHKTPIQSIQAIKLVKGTSKIELELVDGAGDTRYNLPVNNNYIYYPDSEFSMSGNYMITGFAELRGVEFFTQVDYVGGFLEVPPPVRMATIEIASDFIMRHVNKEGLQSITQGRVSKSWKDRTGGQSDFILDAQELLKPYRRASGWL